MTLTPAQTNLFIKLCNNGLLRSHSTGESYRLIVAQLPKDEHKAMLALRKAGLLHWARAIHQDFILLDMAGETLAEDLGLTEEFRAWRKAQFMEKRSMSFSCLADEVAAFRADREASRQPLTESDMEQISEERRWIEFTDRVSATHQTFERGYEDAVREMEMEILVARTHFREAIVALKKTRDASLADLDSHR